MATTPVLNFITFATPQTPDWSPRSTPITKISPTMYVIPKGRRVSISPYSSSGPIVSYDRASIPIPTTAEVQAIIADEKAGLLAYVTRIGLTGGSWDPA